MCPFESCSENKTDMLSLDAFAIRFEVVEPSATATEEEIEGTWNRVLRTFVGNRAEVT
jgi:hypothetical protein